MSPERVRYRHGFPSEICPSCAGLGESNPLVSVEAKALNKLSARYAKALAVVEAARGLDKWQTVTEDSGFANDDEAEAAFEAFYSNWANLRAALAAFDEEEGS